MCGIAGIFNTDGRSVAVAALKSMTDAIAHRGPDGEGAWIHSFIGLGHRRLAILDLSPLAHQPMQTRDGSCVLTYNGEIYNFQNLRVELEARGHAFRSRSDSEVVLAAYREWGADCVHRFNGMFAFAIWDTQRNRLFLARDRYGIKPLYYWFQDGTLVFASEIKAILRHPDVGVRVCVPALNEYFSFQNVFSDLTLFEGIRLLPAAHTMTLDLDSTTPPRVERYWDFAFEEDAGLKDEREYLEELERLFEQAVNRQLVSDVEVGAYLSGGMDSGSITCIAARNFPNLKSFTGGFDLSSASGLELGFDERAKAEFLSSRFRTEHYEVVLKAGDMERVMPDLIRHMEDPRVGQSYPNYYVARLASKFVKVVLSGAGGDELFAGYPWRYYRAVVNDGPEHYADKYYRYWQRLIPDSLKPSFYQGHLQPAIQSHPCKDIFGGILADRPNPLHTPEDYVNQSLYLEARTFLHGLLVVEDKLSMAHGLETRVPFLDNDLVDFAMRLPVRHKLRDLKEVVGINENELGPKSRRFLDPSSDGKILLRKAFARYVPDAYANGVKQGFSAPDASWFKGESIDYVRSLLFSRKARIYDYIQPSAAQELMNGHFNGQANRRLLIWSFLCFEWWLKTFMP
ncbi:asparagine synthase (glutamine-hydrolyzing) [Geothrix sp. PMB-07]|uniref:asparagine synthase (glutamine-hydrolyzing) n=1 Tax=Geothrix sp. PMB-07 TaxID=3068640 RepID=UPI0027408C8F|nr:asparagine synthase (glutamine-hydrolyzing) [Geothrix sp. PMB-07]WLT31798.1 asparagine synthase (glutamine-hydrolyzing) [Geothrix sp. PMB-07]